MDDHHASVAKTQIFLTAAESYPALERQFLRTRSNISAGFRVFDPRTKLRSAEAKAIGENWFDLVAHTLARGVRFRLILTDFDPVVRPAAHRMTWNAIRRLISAAEASGRPDLLDLTPAMHAARIGTGASMLLWPKVMKEIGSEAKRLNDLSKAAAQRDLTMMPLLAPYISGTHPNFKANKRSLPRLVPTTHHQKVAVFDGETVYLGGLDLDERRYDTPDHDRPSEETWRDCQILTSGAVAKEAEQHLNEVVDVTAGKAGPSPTQTLLRTLSRPRKGSKFGLSPDQVVSELEEEHIRQIKAAKTLVYFETQFFRSVPLAEALCEAAKTNPSLQMLLLLPGAPESVAFEGSTTSDARYGEYLQAKCIDMVVDAFGKSVFVTSPAKRQPTSKEDRSVLKSAPLIYVHAKVSIFDDQAAIVSSANLNGRSLRWDTEVGMTLTSKEEVAELTERCFDHWLPVDTKTDISHVVDEWRSLAKQNEKTPPNARRGFLLPYPIKPARRFGKNLPGIPEEMT